MDRESTPHGKVRAMRVHLQNPFLLLALRLLLGLAFVVAGADKIGDPAAFGVSIDNYRILPDFLIPIPATMLPWVELLCGLAILFGILTRGGSLLVSVLLVIFTAAAAAAIVRGLDISCGCFTQDPGAAALGWGKVWENLGLLCAGLILLYAGEGSLSLQHYLRKDTRADSPPAG
ncbi:MAG: MauE/DoxX family redox-associated membrane protein [Thermodesulfobacteriota bacterium]